MKAVARLRLRDLWRSQRALWSLSFVVGLATLAATVLLLASSGWFISAAAAAGAGSLFNYMRPGALIRFFAIVRTAGRYGERLLSHALVLQLLARLRLQAFVRLSQARQLQLGAGERLQRLVADIDLLDQLPLRLLNPLGWALLLGAAYLAVVALWLPAALLPLSFLLAGFALLLWLCSRGLAQLAARDVALQGQRRGLLLENLQLLTTLLATGHWRARLADLAAADDQLHQLQRSQLRRQLGLQAALQLLVLAGLFVLLQALPAGLSTAGQSTAALSPAESLSAGALLSAADMLSPGKPVADAVSGLPDLSSLSVPLWLALLLGWLGLTEVLLPLTVLPASWGQIRAAQQRCNEIWQASALAAERETTGQELTEHDAAEREAVPVRLAGGAAGLQLRQLRFGFQASLGQLSADCQAGAVVLLRGKSGSGKSCLLQTLAGELAALGGQMLLNGQPFDALTDSQRCQLAGYLPQRPYLFGLSIAAELRLARANATDDELLAVLALVELSDWLAHQPQGLRTVLADDGVGLSGGELKRFALARLLLLKPPLLLLDEPFAGLHSALAERLLARLTAFQRDGILLIASHQLQQSACFSQCWDLSQPEPAARAGAEGAM